MTTADDLRAFAPTLDKAAGELDLLTAALAAANDALAEANTLVADLERQLAECQEDGEPDYAVPMGLYSGGLGQLEDREAQLGLEHTLGGWDFSTASFGAKLPSTWDTGREYVMPNIHARTGGTHHQWTEVAAGKYDTGLIATLKSCALTQTPVWLSVHEEADGADGALHCPSGAGAAQRASAYRAFFDHVRDLAKVHCPEAMVGQVLASSGNFPTWVHPGADFYGFDPHFYTFNGSTGATTSGTFAQALDAAWNALLSQNVADKPFTIHTGIAEPATEAQALAQGFPDGTGNVPGNITAGDLGRSDPKWKADRMSEIAQVLTTARETYPSLAFVTYWDRSGTVNKRAGNETIDSSPAMLQAFKDCF